MRYLVRNDDAEDVLNLIRKLDLPVECSFEGMPFYRLVLDVKIHHSDFSEAYSKAVYNRIGRIRILNLTDDIYENLHKANLWELRERFNGGISELFAVSDDFNLEKSQKYDNPDRLIAAKNERDEISGEALYLDTEDRMIRISDIFEVNPKIQLPKSMIGEEEFSKGWIMENEFVKRLKECDKTDFSGLKDDDFYGAKDAKPPRGYRARTCYFISQAAVEEILDDWEINRILSNEN